MLVCMKQRKTIKNLKDPKNSVPDTRKEDSPRERRKAGLDEHTYH